MCTRSTYTYQCGHVAQRIIDYCNDYYEGGVCSYVDEFEFDVPEYCSEKCVTEYPE